MSTPPRARQRAASGRATRAPATWLWRALDRAYPDARCALVHDGPFQLLVATILSAQCTDVQVNTITPALFARYPDPPQLAAAPIGEVEKLVYRSGFYRAKARNIVAMAAALCREHRGLVPAEMAALVALPGVARKTANVVLGCAFGRQVGVVVDTHVRRLAGRLGLSGHDDPAKVEQDLMALAPRRRWTRLSLQLIEHGRQICVARRPRCARCPLAGRCPSAEQEAAPRTAAGRRRGGGGPAGAPPRA